MAHAEVILVGRGEEISLGTVGHEHRCDLGLIEGLARLQLTARRQGWSLRLRNPSDALAELLSLTGMADVILSETPP